jgi:predicted small lipoprotein YifL
MAIAPGRTILATMKTTRVLLLSAALVLVAACGTKGPLVLADADAAKAGSSQPTGGTSRPLPDDDGDIEATAAGTPVPNADGEIPDEAADDE